MPNFLTASIFTPRSNTKKTHIGQLSHQPTKSLRLNNKAPAQTLMQPHIIPPLRSTCFYDDVIVVQIPEPYVFPEEAEVILQTLLFVSA